MTNPNRAMRRLALAIAVALPAACSTAEKTAPVVVQSVVQNPGRKAVDVTELQSGAAIVLEPGQQLVVTLPLSGTSGYQWAPVDLRPGVLAVLGAKFERAPRDVNTDEAAGTTVWRFAPEAAGTVALRLELRRPRSLEPATQTVNYTVTVK